MRRVPKSILLISLLLYLSGCSSYRYVTLPGSSGPSREPEVENIVRLQSNAKVTLKSGQIVSGEVVRVSGEELVLGKPGNFGLEEKVFQAGEIDTIEVEYNSSGDKVVLYSVLGLVVLGTIGAVAYSNGLEEGLGGLN